MLHELVEYAKDQGLAAEPGFSAKQVRWLLVFDEQGQWVGSQDLTGGDKKSKGVLFAVCPDLTMPEMISAGKGTRHFLVDALDKVVLLTKDGEVTPKLASEHEYFVNLLRQASTTQAILADVALTLCDDQQLQAMRDELIQKKAKPTDSATLGISQARTGKTRTLVQESWWHDWWRGFRQNLLDSRQAKASKGSEQQKGKNQMLCLLTGKQSMPAATHPKITNLSDVGGLSMGDALLSFNKEAFTSYDLEQGSNAAICEEMAATYTGALNDLLRKRCHRLSNVKIVYWYAGVDIEPGSADDILHVSIQFDNPYEDADVANENSEDSEPAISQSEINAQYGAAAKLVQAIQSGQRPDLIQARFYSLILSANSGRVVIRDWQQGSFVDLANAVKKWFDDLSIIARDGRSILRSFKFLALVGACVRDLKDAPASLELGLWKCALDPNRQIPDAVAAQVLERVRNDILNDQSPRHARYALLKAYLIRKGITMTEEHDVDCNHPAYICGCILSVLAHLQSVALKGVKAGFVERYYASASSTPGLVLGRLIRTSNMGHLRKITSSSIRQKYQDLIGDLIIKIDNNIPSTLGLTDQTLFALGYYKQNVEMRSFFSNDELHETEDDANDTHEQI